MESAVTDSAQIVPMRKDDRKSVFVKAFKKFSNPMKFKRAFKPSSRSVNAVSAAIKVGTILTTKTPAINGAAKIAISGS
jgi:hypothetical protein